MLNKKLIALFVSSILVGCGNGDDDISVSNIGKPSEDIQAPEIKPDNVNTPPVLAQIPNLIGVADKEITYQVISRSNSGRQLQYTIKNNPVWVSINKSGLITLSPKFSDFGNISFTVVVADGSLSTKQLVNVTIDKHNIAPVILNTIDTFRAKTNKLFKLSINVKDLNDDTLVYSEENLPTWLTFNSTTGEISGTPTDNDYGQYDFDIIVDDGKLQTKKNFKIQVVEEKELEVKSLMEMNKIDLSSISKDIANPDSIAVDEKYIYIANDTAQGSIFIIDKNTGKLIKTISMVEKDGKSYTYNHVSDIYVANGRLYVASLSSNRVDIINTSTFSLITSLGVGSWAGEDKYTLVHPQAVIANDKYVFVIDKNSEIIVYQQTDIENNDFFHIPKYSYLYLGGNSINRKQQLVIKDNHLLVNDISDNLLAAYDINKIEKNLNRSNAIQPVNLTNSLSMLAADDNSWLTVANNVVNISRSISYANNDLLFNDSYINTSQDNEGNNYKNLIDSEISNNIIYNLKNDNLFIDSIYTDTARIESDMSVQKNEVKLDSIPSENISQSLQNGTSWDDLTNPEKNSFTLNHLIKINFDKQHNIIVTSYAAQETKNVDIKIKLKGTNTWFNAFTLDKLPAYGSVIIPSDKISLDKLNTTENNKVVDLSNFINDDRYNLNAIFDNDFSSKTDTLIQKLKTINVDWIVSFGKYSKADGKWAKITPLYAREWVIMATNFAYLISSPEFKYTWFHFKDIYGKDFYGNDGPQESVNGFFTPDEYNQYYNEIMHRTSIRAGITTIGGGLGGGDVWGVDTWIFYSHYYAKFAGASLGAVAHEFGHHWGSHYSAWSNEGFGFQKIGHQLNQYFVRDKSFPYTDDNINGFYKASNKDRYGHGVENSFRQPLGALNPLEIYLKNHYVHQ